MRARNARSAGRSIATVLMVLSVSGASTFSSAFAQGVRHADRVEAATQALSRGAPCSDETSEDYMRRRMAASGAVQPVLYEALLDISLSDTLCEPLRTAATRLAWEIVESPVASVAPRSSDPGSGGANSASAVASIVSEAYAEADARAAVLSFAMTPPPRNITRNRSTGTQAAK